ncbi:glutamyl tRNA-Gln amidotransferase chain B [Streptococcus pneumoniae]|nr:glutamyl tRNA-Gln amidotransferase chain B [Streptococcus pneumoniae]
MNAEGKTLEQIELTPENLVEMIAIIEDGTISSKIAKKVFVHLAKNGGGAREYVEKAGMVVCYRLRQFYLQPQNGVLS